MINDTLATSKSEGKVIYRTLAEFNITYTCTNQGKCLKLTQVHVRVYYIHVHVHVLVYMYIQ